MKVNNELNINVDKQQGDIKHVKEQCDIDIKDEVKDITATITPMKKKKPVCVVCNQTFVNKKMAWKIKYPGRAY